VPALARGRPVALVVGGKWHDFAFAGDELRRLLASQGGQIFLGAEDFETVSDLSPDALLVTYTCDVRPSAAASQGLVRFVSDGGTWLALHATNSAIDVPAHTASGLYETPRALRDLPDVLGSQFVAHPPIAPHLIEVTDPSHALTRGIDSFTVSDELYVCELHEPVQVLLHTDFGGASPAWAEGDPDGEQRRPVLYLRPYGEGMVCYFTLGHCRGRHDIADLGVPDIGRVDRGSWTSPEFHEVLRRCVAWGLGTLEDEVG
jgi:hypothetical protein